MRGAVRAGIAWTAVALVAGIAVAAIAALRLYEAQQACFFDSAVPCPREAGLLPFAFFGVPALWLAGLSVIAVVPGLKGRSARR